MTARLPPDWPPCGACNSDARVGSVCRNAGDGYGYHCRWHGGLDLPGENWGLWYSSDGIYIGQGEPQLRVSWKIAARLVELGRVRRGVFFRRSGQSLIRRIRSAKVPMRILVEHRIVREYAFFGAGP